MAALFPSLADAFRTGAAATPLIDPKSARKDPREAQAQLTRAQFDLFENTVSKGETALLDFARDKSQPDTFAKLAGQDAAQAFDSTAGLTQRRLSRYGVTMDSDQKAVTDRLRGLDRGLAVVGAENGARRGITDLQTESLGAALQIGRGVNASASESLAGAAGLASQREALGSQIDAQNSAMQAQQRQGQMSTVMGGIGLGASLGAAGVAGLTAASGAALGAGAGLLLAFL